MILARFSMPLEFSKRPKPSRLWANIPWRPGEKSNPRPAAQQPTDRIRATRYRRTLLRLRFQCLGMTRPATNQAPARQTTTAIPQRGVVAREQSAGKRGGTRPSHPSQRATLPCADETRAYSVFLSPGSRVCGWIDFLPYGSCAEGALAGLGFLDRLERAGQPMKLSNTGN